MDERTDQQLDDMQEEIEAFSQFYGTACEAMARYTHCSHCGANLHFTHITDFSRNLTQESARCLECGLKIRKLVHQLQ